MYRYKSLQIDENMGIKRTIFPDFGYVSNNLTLPLYVLASEEAVLKSRHSISLKCSLIPRYRPY